MQLKTRPNITSRYSTLLKDPAELGVQPKGPGINYADPQLTRVKTSKDPVTPPPRWSSTKIENFYNFSVIQTSWKANQLHFLPRKDGRVNTQFHFHFPTNQLNPTLKWLGKIRGCHRLCYRDDRFCGDPWKVSSPFPFQSHPSFLYKWTLDKYNDFLVFPPLKSLHL